MKSELSQAAEIASGIRRHRSRILAAESKWKSLALEGFPFDAWLLSLSPLYRLSRRRFLSGGGRLVPALISSPRSLSSDQLLQNLIEYSPVARELYWSATDRLERRNPGTSHPRILEIRSYCAPVFHEQSHRLLWNFLPPPPRDEAGIRRYLNFCEALVVATDMALGDCLGSGLSRLFYLTGATYDPGTRVWTELKSRRRYREYLKACVLATYLNLELYEAGDIAAVVERSFSGLGPYASRAVERCLRLDRAFVEITNTGWQDANWKKLRMLWNPKARLKPLDPGLGPTEGSACHAWVEKWFAWMGL